MEKIPLSKCIVDDETKEAALRALSSGRYILSGESEAFEKELAAHTGVPHAVLVSSWTMGVFLLHKAMGLQPGDEVIVPSHTAFPSIEPLIHCGAKPIFVDVDDYFCADPSAIEAAITPRTVGIIPVHIYGHPANLAPILALAEKKGLWVMEDCAQAQGAKHEGRTVGSIAKFGAFSFFPSKNLTVMGDGGLITTHDAAMAEKVRMLRNHGRQSKYTHEMVGFNVRFNDVQAAIGRVGLKHLDRRNAHRRAVAAIYNQRLAPVAQTPMTAPYAEPVYHMYVIRVDRRNDLATYLKDNGVETGLHYPVANHQQPAITSLYNDLPSLPRTEKLVNDILSLPIHGEMPLEHAERVCDLILSYYRK